MGQCVVCSRSTSGSLEFCGSHYKEYKEDILGKKPWVRVLKSDAQRERRRRAREFADESLDQILDRPYRDRY